ncbi:antibiotic biosynthesis monooxygenase [Urbifossiella limnaea]|uniref:Antibiotic biosynthesis monooxygenase n=1 Tax=Urbifossiella limnaea TaxID=2528023 RepID=A0A517XN00_9BACT|nr:antibiotic biosynthesis monooxygenase [Urbifossiella limnaea]QDU18889.1 Antibiotic biosynthesis monooxygenase [Urbifossiella limnaea]
MHGDGPVTLVVHQRVRPGHEAAFEDWLRGITRAMQGFGGHPGFQVRRPTDPKQPEYLVLIRFDTLPDLEAWERSDARREWLERASPLLSHPWVRERHTGLEVWFTPPPGRAQPPRHKQVVVTAVAVYPLLLLTQLVVTPALTDWPVLARPLAVAALMVPAMTYLVMPLATRAFARWLYGGAG